MKRVETIIRILEANTEETPKLDYVNPLELLVATILSAQSTDAQINKITPQLFKRYKTAKDYANADINELETLIHSSGFYHNKAKNIKGCCHTLMERFSGKVPESMEDMLELPGVGRKTANCVLGAVFGIPGVVVDTHVKRLTMRMGLTENASPDKIEKDVEKLLPPEKWRRFSDILIYHGRAVCNARKPACDSCPVAALCISYPL